MYKDNEANPYLDSVLCYGLIMHFICPCMYQHHVRDFVGKNAHLLYLKWDIFFIQKYSLNKDCTIGKRLK
jgi:hypothetical protein